MLQARLSQHAAATEEERINNPVVWFGHKQCRPAKTKGHRQGWSLEDVTEGSYVCFQGDESSEYFHNAGFEVGKVLKLPRELMDDAEINVEYHQFDM